MQDNSIIPSEFEVKARPDAEKGPTEQFVTSPNDSGIITPLSEDLQDGISINCEGRKPKHGFAWIFVWLLRKSNEGQPVDTSPPPDGGIRAVNNNLICPIYSLHFLIFAFQA